MRICFTGAEIKVTYIYIVADTILLPVDLLKSFLFVSDGIVDVPDRIPVRNTRGSNVVLRRKMSLPPFGLATYMLVGDVWLNHGYSDYGKLCDLHQAACAWVNELNFFHHDFNFFSTRSGVQYQMT